MITEHTLTLIFKFVQTDKYGQCDNKNYKLRKIFLYYIKKYAQFTLKYWYSSHGMSEQTYPASRVIGGGKNLIAGQSKLPFYNDW